jgi:hypothetical protein
MPFLNDRQEQIALRFLLGLALTEIPVLTIALGEPGFDPRKLAIGLLGGLVTALEKVRTTRADGPVAVAAARAAPAAVRAALATQPPPPVPPAYPGTFPMPPGTV